MYKAYLDTAVGSELVAVKTGKGLCNILLIFGALHFIVLLFV